MSRPVIEQDNDFGLEDYDPVDAASPGVGPTIGLLARSDVRIAVVTDVAATVVLAGCAVHAFDPAYGSDVWWRVGLVGVAAGTVVAYLASRFRWSPITTVLALVAGFVLTGASAVPDAAVFGVLPGPATPGALFDGITRGWARLMTTVAPVGDVDHLAAIVHLGGFSAAAGALLLARRTTVSWLPPLPPLVVLGAALLVGTRNPASTYVQGAVAAAVTIAWMSHRASRNRPRVHVVGTGVWARRLTAVTFTLLVVAGGTAVFQVQSMAGPDQRKVLRDQTEPPFDPSDHPSPLVGYPAWRIEHHEAEKADRPERPLLQVRGTLPRNVPLRIGVMDVYDGGVWLVGGPSNAADQTGSGRFVRVGSDLRAVGDREAGQSIRRRGATSHVDVTIEVENYRSVWIPTPGGVESLTFDGDGADQLRSGLRFNKVTGSAAVTGGVDEGTTFSLRADVPVASFVGPEGDTRDRIVGDAPVDPAVVLPAIVDVAARADASSESVAEDPAPSGGIDIGQVADALVGDAAGDYARAVALESALRAKGKGFFADGLEPVADNPLSVFRSGHNLYQLRQFLGSVGPTGEPVFVGNAERYSAAMAVMARKLGMPARVVVGFRADADDRKPAPVSGDATTFTANQVDAWVEIAFRDVGWVAFFPTPPRSQNDLPAQPPEQRSTRAADVQAQPPVSPPPNPATLQEQLDRLGEREQDAADTPLRLPTWAWQIVRFVVFPLALVIGTVAMITGYKRWRRRRRRTHGTPVDRVSGAWAEMLDQLRDLGARVPHEGTRREIAASVTGADWEQLPGFAAGIDAAMFGPDDPDDESVASIWKWVDRERSALLEALRRRHRWRVGLSPRSLWPWR